MSTASAKPFTADTGLYSQSVNAANLSINSNLVIGGANPTALQPYITDSALQTLGTLSSLNVNGTISLRSSGQTVLTVINGQLVANSKTLGSINNVDLGVSKPGKVKTSELIVATQAGAPGIMSIPGVSIDATDVTFNGAITFADGISIANQPSKPSDATRKDYVDALSIAYSVVFGA